MRDTRLPRGGGEAGTGCQACSSPMRGVTRLRKEVGCGLRLNSREPRIVPQGDVICVEETLTWARWVRHIRADRECVCISLTNRAMVRRSSRRFCGRYEDDAPWRPARGSPGWRRSELWFVYGHRGSVRPASIFAEPSIRTPVWLLSEFQQWIAHLELRKRRESRSADHKSRGPWCRHKAAMLASWMCGPFNRAAVEMSGSFSK